MSVDKILLSNFLFKAMAFVISKISYKAYKDKKPTAKTDRLSRTRQSLLNVETGTFNILILENSTAFGKATTIVSLEFQLTAEPEWLDFQTKFSLELDKADLEFQSNASSIPKSKFSKTLIV